MRICADCFNDEEMRLAVWNENGSFGVCDVCGRKSNVIDVEVLSEFFWGVLKLFATCEEGINVVSLLQRDWNLFSDEAAGAKIVDYFLRSSGDDFGYSLDDKVDYECAVQQIVGIWEELKTNVKERSRFFTNLDTFNELGLIRANWTLPKGTELYRARVMPSGADALGKEDMGCPPSGKATAGRANPLGIPYLYLCQEEETTYYEVRAVYLDRLAIGKFRVSRDLQIMDFTQRLSLYVANTQSSDWGSDISNFLLLQSISHDMSKPLRRFDTELEYVPTQLICEYCKLNKIDGIKFSSSVHKGGTNIVLFNSNDAEYMGVSYIEIKSVKITSTED